MSEADTAVAELPEGMHMPAVMGINCDLSNTPTEDHKALVIRLELNYYEYSQMEDLIQEAIVAREARRDVLAALLTEARSDSSAIPAPFTKFDLERALSDQTNAISDARRMLNKVMRPPTASFR